MARVRRSKFDLRGTYSVQHHNVNNKMLPQLNTKILGFIRSYSLKVYLVRLPADKRRKAWKGGLCDFTLINAVGTRSKD